MAFNKSPGLGLQQEVKRWNLSVSGSAVWLLIGLASLLGLAIAGLSPAGTAELSLLNRSIFWVTQIAVGAGLCLSLEFTWLKLTTQKSSNWTVVGGCGVIGSLIYTPFAWQMELLFSLSVSPTFLWAAWINEWKQLFIPFVGCWLLLRSRVKPPVDSGATTARYTPTLPKRTNAAVRPLSGDPFWQELPDHLGRDVVWVRAEEHYLRVATTEGKTLIRFSLQNAVSGALAPVPGLRVHRSYWVAINHVRRLKKGQQHLNCEMDDSTLIPVSRRRRTAVKAALAARTIYPQSELPAQTGCHSNQ